MIKCFRFVDAFVLVNQHGRRNVNCKPAIDGLQSRDETAMLVDKTIANYGSYFA